MTLLIAVLAAFFIQGAISVNHPRVGAALGFVITTGVLLYGLMIYRHGGIIVLFVLPLSHTWLIGFCIAWYIWDAMQFMQTKR